MENTTETETCSECGNPGANEDTGACASCMQQSAALAALSLYLGVPMWRIEKGNMPHHFYLGIKEYLVMTEEEATEAAFAAAEDCLWAFDAGYLSGCLGLSDSAARAIAKMQVELCEDAQEIVVALLGERKSDVIEDAIATDGRGHFLSSYDGQESEQNFDGETFFIYRNN